MINSKAIFPFSAVVGHATLKTALLLNCIDNKIGGVLISGSRGSAKSTIARGLSDFLPTASHFVTLPLGASEEHLTGSLDINSALNDNSLLFKPGMLHKAHQGILYIDEVNLLPDHLIDIMLDAAASGINYVERDGISQQHAAEFILIGTMNPDEGTLRPQLLDRFGLSVAIEVQNDPSRRIQIMENRLDFETNPALFRQQHQAALQHIKQLILAARARLAQIHIPDSIKLKVATACIAANVDGLRADIVWLRTAKAYAALNGSNTVTASDIEFVRPMVLHHRQHSAEKPQPPQEKSSARPPASSSSGVQQEKPAHIKKSKEAQGQWGDMPGETIISDPPEHLNSSAIATFFQQSGLHVNHKTKPGNDISCAQKRDHRGQSLSQQAGKLQQNKTTIDWCKTLFSHKNIVADASKKRLPVFKKSSRQHSRLHIILLDTSASTMAKKALAKAKSLVINISQHAYFAREQLAVLSFGNQQCHWLISPQRAPKDCRRLLDHTPSGGGTPLRHALIKAQQLINKLALGKPSLTIQTYLLSDGRSTESFTDLNWKTPIAVIDMETQAIRLGRAEQIAQQLNARYQPISSFIQQQVC